MLWREALCVVRTRCRHRGVREALLLLLGRRRLLLLLLLVVEAAATTAASATATITERLVLPK